jgi:hypothetical protein
MSSDPSGATFLIAVASLKYLNPKRRPTASHLPRTIMKIPIIVCICSMALAMGLFAQVPTVSPTPSPAATASVAASVSPSDLAERIQQKLEEKLSAQKGIIVQGGDRDEDADLKKMREFVAIPIVAIVFLSIFGAPVLIVMMIGLFTLLVTRMRQRTIRMMVEKGQPVPAELLSPTRRTVRQRSDVRRGVIWAMIGLGAMIFFGAVNDWEGGAWSIGLIPFLIGLGYLMVWKLEGKKDIPPPGS